MLLIRRLLCVCALGMVSSVALASEKPATMKLCYENEDVYPWVLKDRPGLNIFFMNALEKKLGVKLELIGLPWKRCQEEVKAGAIDGLFSASFKPDRLEIGVYPMAGDKPDESKAVMMDGYTLFRLKGNNAVQWDGKKLTVPGSVGAQPGYSVIDQLKGLGVKVDDGARSADDTLRKLIAGRIDAAALQTLEGTNSLRTQAEFNDKIEAVSPVLVSKPYFLMLSKQFVGKYADFSKNVWNEVAAVRESAEYKAKAASFK